MSLGRRAFVRQVRANFVPNSFKILSSVATPGGMAFCEKGFAPLQLAMALVACILISNSLGPPGELWLAAIPM